MNLRDCQTPLLATADDGGWRELTCPSTSVQPQVPRRHSPRRVSSNLLHMSPKTGAYGITKFQGLLDMASHLVGQQEADVALNLSPGSVACGWRGQNGLEAAQVIFALVHDGLDALVVPELGLARRVPRLQDIARPADRISDLLHRDP
jgi:hypothetical protein